MTALAFYLGLSRRSAPGARLERERARNIARLEMLLAEIKADPQAVRQPG